MTLALRRVAAAERADWVHASFRFYVTDLIEHAGLTRDEAEAKARLDQADMLAGREPGPDQHLYWIEEDERVVGRLWFAERDAHVWLYQVDIDEKQRGRGLGREAMRLFEDEVRWLRAAEIWLNVNGGNVVARSLYSSLGYGEASVHMSKKL